MLLLQGLWAEHLGAYEEVFQFPQSLECVKRVQELAAANWQRYVDDTSGHTQLVKLDCYWIVIEGRISICSLFQEFHAGRNELLKNHLTVGTRAGSVYENS